MPHVKPRTNLATVTMPVRLASAKEIERVGDSEMSLYNVQASSTVEVPQFSILLTRKGPTMPKLRSGAKLPVFAQLNKIKAMGVTFKARRRHLLTDLKFAGIAFTHAKREEDVGDSNLMAAVIGGSHTVMSYRSDHSDEPIRPGTTVRWTLPGEGVADVMSSLTDVPVRYTGTGDDILPELEPVDPSKMLAEIIADAFVIEELKTSNTFPSDGNISMHVDGILANPAQRKTYENIITAYDNMRSREIGTVICDNGRGSIDIRLK